MALCSIDGGGSNLASLPISTGGNGAGQGVALRSGGCGASGGSTAGGGAGGTCMVGMAGGLPWPSQPAYGNTSNRCPSCLAPDSSVVLADGTPRSLGELKVGDLLRGAEGKQERIIYVSSAMARRLLIKHEFGSFECSRSHRVMLRDSSSLSAEELVVGDHQLVLESGALSSIHEIVDRGQGTVIGISCLPSHKFVSEGVVHHNKASGQLPSSIADF